MAVSNLISALFYDGFMASIIRRLEDALVFLSLVYWMELRKVCVWGRGGGGKRESFCKEKYHVQPRPSACNH